MKKTALKKKKKERIIQQLHLYWVCLMELVNSFWQHIFFLNINRLQTMAFDRFFSLYLWISLTSWKRYRRSFPLPYLWFWIQNSCFPRLAINQRLENPVYPDRRLIAGGVARWIHNFPNVIMAKANATGYTGIWTRFSDFNLDADNLNYLYSYEYNLISVVSPQDMGYKSSPQFPMDYCSYVCFCFLS